MRKSATRLVLLATAVLAAACGQNSGDTGAAAEFDRVWAAAVNIDSVGVSNIAEGDTIVSESGLTMYETTGPIRYDPDNLTELFAWEFYAESLNPVKLLVARFTHDRAEFELIGESEVVIPRQLGPNRLILREPVPIGPDTMYGLFQPEGPVVPFRKIRNWKSMLTVKSFERPLMRRDWFAVYGWRFAMKVFWRDAQF